MRVEVAATDRATLAARLREGLQVVGTRWGGEHVMVRLEGEIVAPMERGPTHEPLPVTLRLAELPFDEGTRAAVLRVHREAFDADGSATYRYLEALPAATCWLAEADGEVVGFKMGAAKGSVVYHSHEGGVLRAQRRRGVARALMDAQHRWAAEEGYRRVTTSTFGRFLPMLLLDLQVGFEIIGTSWVPGEAAPKLHLAKRL